MPIRPPMKVIDTDAKAIADVREMQDTSLYGLDSEGADPTNPNRLWDPHPKVKKHQIIVWSYYDHARKVRSVIHGNLLKHYARWLADKKARKVGSMWQFDLSVFAENGFPVNEESIVGDTVTESFQTDENRLQHGLKQNALERGIVMKKFDQLFGMPALKKDGTPAKNKPRVMVDLWDVFTGKAPAALKTTLQDLYEYASEDPWASVMIHLYHKKQMVEEGTWSWYSNWELPLTFCLSRMEKRGIKLDIPMLEAIGKEAEAQQARIECVFRSEVGKPHFNLGSNEQKRKLLIDELNWPIVKYGDETSKGERNPSLDHEAMEEYADEYGFELANWLMDWQGVTTLRNTFIDGLLAKVYGQGDGICRTRFNQTRAKTQRLSSGDAKAKPYPLPNLQNIPRRPDKDPYGIRGAFVKRPGCKLLVKDYSGIELIAIAEVSKDPVLFGLLIRGENAHAKTACALFGLDYPKVKVNKEGKVTHEYKEWLEHFKVDHQPEYDDGKKTNFSLNYRMSVGTYAKRLGFTEEDAAARIDAYFGTYRGIAQYMTDIVKQARRDGYVTTLAGSRRRLTHILHKNRGLREHAERAAINAPIQGVAAKIIAVAMVELDRAHRRGQIQTKQLIQVHDELVMEGPENEVPKDEPTIDHIMVTRPREVLGLKIPLSVSGGMADNWKAAK